MTDPKKPDTSHLTKEQYDVTQCSATEAPFTGEYWNTHDDGTYTCVVCGHELFKSDDKFDSGTGWPSFDRPAGGSAVDEKEDASHGMRRTETVCGNCGAHLGHLFPDGPRTTGMRYCINSAALKLKRAESGKGQE
ncbi:MAG: peptide-methionine (R)-S-oxide reductase MsrB [Candidatus Peribacteraceae bacterium]|nr:peptide-methionine (R)-S-oxide reductase MsrB [Candidatus Peribacteraceae bacterium]